MKEVTCKYMLLHLQDGILKLLIAENCILLNCGHTEILTCPLTLLEAWAWRQPPTNKRKLWNTETHYELYLVPSASPAKGASIIPLTYTWERLRQITLLQLEGEPARGSDVLAWFFYWIKMILLCIHDWLSLWSSQ